jgi:protein SCO1/2
VLAAGLLVTCAIDPRPFAHAYARKGLASLPPVALVTTGGKQLPLATGQNRWVWLFMGYANCPDVCPTTLSYLADAYRRLGTPDKVRVIFVSLDPERDSPDQVAKHAAYYHPAFLGGTARRPVLDELAHGLGATYEVGAPQVPGGSYTVTHPNMIYVLDPKGRLAATYTPGRNPSELARDFDALTH